MGNHNSIYKKVSRKIRRMRIIWSICSETGWTRSKAKTELSIAGSKGIPASKYLEHKLYKLPKEKHIEVYREIRQQEKTEKQRQTCIAETMEKTGWSKEETVKHIEATVKRLGISYDAYRKNKFYHLSEKEQDEKYRILVEKREKARVRKEKKKRNEELKESRVQAVMKETGWSHEEALKEMTAVRDSLGASFRQYLAGKLYLYPSEEQAEQYQRLKKREEQRRQRKLLREEIYAEICRETNLDKTAVRDSFLACRSKLGCTVNQYKRLKLYLHDIVEQESIYNKFLERKKKREEFFAKEDEKYLKKTIATTGWTRAEATAKISKAKELTGCTNKEFFIYRFYELGEEAQKKVFLIVHSKQLIKKYGTDKEFGKMLVDKAATNEFFNEYMGRPWCVNTEVSSEEFNKLFSETDRVFYKPLGGHRGQGIKDYRRPEEGWAKTYEEITKLPPGVVEQYITQHPDLSILAPSSVNTVRIVTVSSNVNPVTEDGKMRDIAYASLRIGGGTSFVDNFHSGGMVANIDLETGILVTDATDQEGNVFKRHPKTGIRIKGFKVPFFSEAVEMVKDAIEKKNIQGYLGWDIAITEKGPVLVELNLAPGVVLISTPYAPEHKGMKYIADRYLWDE